MKKAYSLGLYEKALPEEMDLPDKLYLAGKAGFDHFEISIDETGEKLQRLSAGLSFEERIKAAVEKTRMPILSMCLSGHRKYPLGSRDPLVRERSLQIMEEAIAFSQRIGIRMIQLAGYDVYYEQGGPDTEAMFFENLKKCVEMASRAGVLLGFETMETPFMNSVEKSMRYVRAINSPYLNVYPDIGNVTNGAMDAVLDLKTGEGKIVAAHLKETKLGVYRNLQFGEGSVDFAGCIAELKRQGVKIYLCEFWYDGKTEPLEYISRPVRFFKSYFED